MAKRPELFSRHQLELPFQATSFDLEAFDNLIASNGVTLLVYSASVCPLGLTDADDVHSHMGHDCENGFRFRFEGEVQGSFLGNSSQPNFQGSGIYDDSTVTVTVKRFYDCPEMKPVVIGHYFKIFIKDCPVLVNNSEVIEHHQSGVDRCSYPVISVQRLSDSRGIEYSEGQDFEIQHGLIKWFPNKGPGYDTVAGRGVVISVTYHYMPHYFVKQIPHQIRVAKQVDPSTGEVSLVAANQMLLLQREWAAHSEFRAQREKTTDRDVAAPRDGGFGPR